MIGPAAGVLRFTPADAKLTTTNVWAERHRPELLDSWQRARDRAALQRIAGADVE